jgi:thiopeptide-type bacteriocin biosynthesis protein
MPTYPVYRHAGLVLARAATDPIDIELPGDRCLSAGEIDPQAALAWMRRTWARSDIAAAVRFASPALADQVERLLHTRANDARQVRRTVLAVSAYLLRWHGRATPFGLFAGVAPATVGATATARFGPANRVVVRADGQWLASFIDVLECHAGLQPQLTVTVNSGGFTRGDRFVVPARVPDGTDGVGQPAEISVRLTAPVRAALTTATQPITTSDLAEALSVQFPAAAPQKIAVMLSRLIGQGVLLTCLRPPATAPDPLPGLAAALRAAARPDLPDIAQHLADLDVIKELTARHNTCVYPAEAEAIRAEITAREQDLHSSAAPVLTADVALDAEIAVPELVLREAEAAATAMLRLTAQPFGPTYWKDFQYRFRARYGPGALVSVRDLVADSGLGFPASYLDAPRGRPAYTISPRDQTIMALIQQAAIDGQAEIVLTEPLIRALTVGDPAEVVPPSRVEIGFEVHAASAEEIRHGRFRLWVTAAPRPESSMIGRFAHLLDKHDQARIAATYATAGSEAAAVQLSFAPRRRDNENITRAPRLLPEVINVAEYPSTGSTISIDDLAVTADATQMYLIRLSTGTRVVPRVMNALEATLRTPPLARFLSEIASARHAVYGAFDYGAARDLPHLPRIRYGRTVLAAARWILTSTDLVPSTSSTTDWQTALCSWRERWHVPSLVLLCQGELRLPLDLGRAFHRALLRSRLERTGKVEIRESPGDSSAGWAGRPCEFLVPMIARTSTRPGTQTPAGLAPPSPPQLPGYCSTVHVQLLGNPARFSEIIITHVPDLLRSLREPPWWYRRHRDTTRPDSDEHLALYLCLAQPGDYGHAVALVSGWVSSLQATGLLADLRFAAYQFQPGRWGTARAAEAAIRVFSADAAAAAAEITMAAFNGIPVQAVAAASMANLAASVSPDPCCGLRAVVAQLTPDTGKLGRDLRDLALALAGPAARMPAVEQFAHGPAVAAAWQSRASAVGTWCDSLAAQRARTSVLPSLLHDHHARAVGVDPDAERITNRLVRTIALRQLALSGAGR